MNYIALGLLIIVGVIVIAAIFSETFQEKIFDGNNSETKIAGVITVQGVSFVVLIIGLAGTSAYLELQNKPEPIPPKMDVEEAITILKNTDKALVSLHFSQDDSINVKLNNTTIAKIKQAIDFDIKKSNSFNDKYEINLEESSLGNFSLDIFENALIYKRGNIYFQDSVYNIQNTSFWFKIEDIENFSTHSGNKIAKYTFKFGEGKTKQTIQWSSEEVEYDKTDNGQLPNSMKLLRDTHWKFHYAIALGAGLFGKNEEGRNYIEMINALLISIRVEK
ncbi:hypothetical protein [Mesonia oceanica]|uniref:Uncharacterized protein n=1 Tax=Mesonia oceanica TaxID=2687242 RepID=A0AC61YDI2_9FLAO|nr:hypothetical protein [Mesonia oceanica]VVV02579.1 hypothetical protein FVB9532_03886 [Mesonia oceanica]|tara:strand:+ start:315 stop:1145 length:831 start_codon:yes stop_codon:yes gene_type:complete